MSSLKETMSMNKKKLIKTRLMKMQTLRQINPKTLLNQVHLMKKLQMNPLVRLCNMIPQERTR